MRRPTKPPRFIYDDPRIYDILMTPGTASELDVLESIEQRFGCGRQRGGLWLEPACGTGRFVRLIARRGRRVVGFDSDTSQLAYARWRLRRLGLTRRARLFQAGMTAFADRIEPGSVDFAFNPVNSLRHLPSDDAVLSHFTQMALVLRPGGLYAVGISLRDDTQTTPEEDVWISVRGRCRVTQLVTYLPPSQGARARRETVISHLMVERPSMVEHHDACYKLRTYREPEWSRLVGRSQLRRLAGVDARGRPLSVPFSHVPVAPYQIEILTHGI